MIFDRDNPGSIYRCLRATRENAHAVRGTLTPKCGTTNATWLKMRDFRVAKMLEAGPGDFFEWVKYRSHLSRGVTIGTMLQDEALRSSGWADFPERATTPRASSGTKYPTRLPGSDDDAERRLLPMERAAAVGRRLRCIAGLSRPDHRPCRRAADPARRHAAVAGPLHEARWLEPRRVANSRSAKPNDSAGELEAHLHLGRIRGFSRRHVAIENFRDRILTWAAGFRRFPIPASA